MRHPIRQLVEESTPLTEDSLLFDGPRSTYGRFRVLHQIGAGSVGPVFRGDDPSTQRPVVIKVIRVGLTPERVSIVATALASMRERLVAHAGLCTMLDSGVQEAEPYVVWDHVEGDSLDVALREYGPANISDALPRLGVLADALDSAAAVGVIHGSLHLRDVIVSPEHTVLTGIGVASVLERVGVRAPARRPYCAPEIAQGHGVSAASDQYALAAIAHEWLSGRRIAGPGAEGVHLPGVDPAGTEAVIEVFCRALDERPEERFPTATAFVDALAAVSDALAPRVRPVRRRPVAEAAPRLMFDLAADDAAAPIAPIDLPAAAAHDVSPLDAPDPVLDVLDARLELAPAEDVLAAHDAPPEAPETLAAFEPGGVRDDHPLADVLAADDETPMSGAPVAYDAPADDTYAPPADSHPLADVMAPPMTSMPDPLLPDPDHVVDAPARDAAGSPLEGATSSPPEPAENEVDVSARVWARPASTSGRRQGDGRATQRREPAAPDGAPSVSAPDVEVSSPAAAESSPLEEFAPIAVTPTEPPSSRSSRVPFEPPLRSSSDRTEPVLPGSGRGWVLFIAALLLAALAGGYALVRWGTPSATVSEQAAAVPEGTTPAADASSGAAPAPAPPAATNAPAPKGPAGGVSAPPARGESVLKAPAPAPAPAEKNAAAPAASAPKAPAATPGQLLVRSTPSGAEVLVNGERRGVTPLTLRELPLGAYTLRVARTGYTANEQRVTLDARRPSRAVVVTLARSGQTAAPTAPAPGPAGRAASAPAAKAAPAAATAPGSLLVETRPPGARVIVDGREIGRTPVTVPALAPGEHTVRIELAGYQTISTTTRVEPGARARVAVSLTTERPPQR